MNAVTDFRRAGLTRVLEPGDDGYDNAVAGFDLGIAIQPDLVINAQTSAEVAAAVAIAADRGEAVAVLGSGHGRLDPIHGGVAITVRSLNAVVVDAGARTARIGAGCDWNPVVAAAAQHGLAAPCGSAPAVGVTGYLLGGGLGPLASSIGFSSDHVKSFEVATPADGAIVVSADSHPDLFWAMRGGKSGFGVVTAITVDLLPVSEIIGGGIYFGADDAAAILTAYAEWAPALPESSTTSVALLRLPPSEALPTQLRGKRVAHVRFASLDTASTAQAQLADLVGVAEPLLNTVGALPYGRVGTIHNDPSTPMRVTNATASLESLLPETVDALLAAAGLETDLPLSSVEIRTLGSAVHRQAPDSDAVGGRSTPHLLNIYASPDPSLTAENRRAAIRTALDAIAAWRAPTNLINFVGPGNESTAVARSWSPEQKARLTSTRRIHDPEGLFPFPGLGTAGSPDGS